MKSSSNAPLSASSLFDCGFLDARLLRMDCGKKRILQNDLGGGYVGGVFDAMSLTAEG